jgi:tRNA nucleotidyltransferase (CCA-adding enzyme)
LELTVQACFAGGAVRDILLGLKPNDVDLSTDASLQEIKALLENEDMIRIVKKGQSEKHGTVMVGQCWELEGA